MLVLVASKGASCWAEAVAMKLPLIATASTIFPYHNISTPTLLHCYIVSIAFKPSV